jgi:hypothetical protein
MNLCDSIEHISTNQHGNESPCALSTTKRKGHDEVVPSNKTPATIQQLLDNARPRHFGFHGNALLHAQSLQGPFQDTGIQPLPCLQIILAKYRRHQGWQSLSR